MRGNRQRTIEQEGRAMTKQCKCEHWQECPVCQPRRFDANGNRLPPEPAPLQAAWAQIEADEALLRQALEALVGYEYVHGAYSNAEAAITALQEQLK